MKKNERFGFYLFTLFLNVIIIGALVALQASTVGLSGGILAAVVFSLPCWALVFMGITWWTFSQKNVFRGRVKDKKIRTQINQALTYQRNLEKLLQVAPASGRRNASMRAMLAQVDRWTKSVHALGLRVDQLQSDKIVRKDLAGVPRSIKSLELRLRQETDEDIQEQLSRTLNNRQTQLESLKRLQASRKRAELELENTISALGTIYSQILTGHSTDHIANYNHLAAEVDDQVERLHDHLEALEEVKLKGL